MPSNSGSVIEGVISVDAGAGLLAAARAQPSGQGLRSQIAGPVPRVRSEGASCGLGEVGPPERVSRVYPGTIERAAPVCAFLARRAARHPRCSKWVRGRHSPTQSYNLLSAKSGKVAMKCSLRFYKRNIGGGRV